MAIRIRCLSCNTLNTADDAKRGKKIRCRECDELLTVPNEPDDGIQEGPAKVNGGTRKRRETEPDESDTRSVKKAAGAGRGLSIVLVAVGVLAVLSCLLVSVGAGAWFFWRQPGPDDQFIVKAIGQEKQPEKKEPARPPAADFHIAQVRKSVVFIKCVTPGLLTATGSGFITTNDGLIYTNRHVAVPDNGNVKGSLLIVGVPSAKNPEMLDYFKADLVYAAPDKDDLDFAILKITAKPEYGEFPALRMSAAKLDLGNPAAAVGYPPILDETPPLSFTKGSISAPRVKFGERSYYQTDAAINPGNSGGPLINASGEAVGIVTLRKRDAQNMGYALYLSEIAKAADEARERGLKIRPEPGPLDPQKMPTLPAVVAKKSSWQINRGQVTEGKGFLEIDANGGQYWMTSKEALPDSFQLVIPCQIMGLQGAQRLQPSQFSILRTLAVRFGTPETDKEILEPKGYLLRFSHTMLLLYRNGEVVRKTDRGNPINPFALVVTRRGNTITVAADGDALMEYFDDDPLPGTHKYSIGGFTSRLRLGPVSVTKLPDVAVVKKIDPVNEKERPVPKGGVGNPAPRQLIDGDVTVRHFKFSQSKGAIVDYIVWANDGKSFFMLREFGLLQRVSIASGQTEQVLDIGHKCTDLAMSGEGLLVANAALGELWVINPDKLSDVRKKIAVPGISRVCAGREASIAWAGTPGTIRRGIVPQAVDLRTGTLLRKHARWQAWVMAVSPDGKYLMTATDEGLTRFRIVGNDDLLREQISYRIGGNNTGRICFSPDSKFVAMPSGGGNGSNLPDHPPLKNYATYIYPIHDLRKAVTGYAAGGYPRTVGIDPKSGCLLAQTHFCPLIVYTFSPDFKLADYPFKGVPRTTAIEINVSPLGGEAIIRTEQHDVFHVKINKGGPSINTIIKEAPPTTSIENPPPVELSKGDLTLRHLPLRENKAAGKILHGVVWAKDGKSFFILHDRGMIQRVNVATGKTDQFIDTYERCGNLALSAEGLLVSVVSAGEVWVLDPDKLSELRRKIAVPKLTYVASGTDASIAWASYPKAGGRGLTVQAIDLKEGKPLAATSKFDMFSFAVTPNGKYLFGHNANELARYRIDKDQLILEESSYRIGKANSRHICISPDSKHVCLPTPGVGNGAGHPDHPKLDGPATFVYPVGNLKKPIGGHVSGAMQNSVGIDPKSGCILAMNPKVPLLVYSFGTDAKLGEYDFQSVRGMTAEFAVSPFGSEAIARTDANGLIHIRINKGGPPIK